MKLILASGSPRRAELLINAEFAFQVDPIKISEIINENLSLHDQIMDLARRKARAYLESRKHLNFKDYLILTADTMVVLGEQTLGKPENNFEAVQFLNSLSGKTHHVITALCLVDPIQDKWVINYDSTEIKFKKLTAEQIQKYVESGEPMDKAGAYAIQGQGKDFVDKIQGSWSNVVGLPMELLERLLKENGWFIDKK